MTLLAETIMMMMMVTMMLVVVVVGMKKARMDKHSNGRRECH